MSVSRSAIENKDEISVAEKHARALGNSDRIQLKFGNYGIELLENGPAIRVSNLYSVSRGVKTNRTFAVVAYPGVIETAFSKEHKAIISGQSIGIVFRNNGWVINKRHLYFGEIEAPPGDDGIASVFGDIGSASPAIHVYSLFVAKHGIEFQYASIAELHHPEYLSLQDLRAVFAAEYNDTRVESAEVADFLQLVKIKMQGA